MCVWYLEDLGLPVEFFLVSLWTRDNWPSKAVDSSKAVLAVVVVVVADDNDFEWIGLHLSVVDCFWEAVADFLSLLMIWMDWFDFSLNCMDSSVVVAAA